MLVYFGEQVSRGLIRSQGIGRQRTPVKVESHGCYFLLLAFQYSEAEALLTLASPLSFLSTVHFSLTLPSLFIHAVLSFSLPPPHMSLVTPRSVGSPGTNKESEISALDDVLTWPSFVPRNPCGFTANVHCTYGSLRSGEYGKPG